MSFDARVQNFAMAIAMAAVVEGTSNVTKKTRPIILAHSANILSVFQMLLFLLYAVNTFQVGDRAVLYVAGQVCAIVSDLLLFYLIHHLTELLNVTKHSVFVWAGRVLMCIAVPLEVIYKYLAIDYYTKALYGTKGTLSLLLTIKGAWACIFLAFATLQFIVITYSLSETQHELYWTLVLRSTKSTLVIMFLAAALVLSSIPPISDISDITQNITNPAQIALKSQVCLMILVRVANPLDRPGWKASP